MHEPPEITHHIPVEKVLDPETARLLAEKDAEIAKWKELAGRDPLTELLNRREGEVRAQEYLAQAARGEITLAYVRLDIDGFKLLNDLQGHDWGDRILISISKKIREIKRGTDEMFRYGGEEIDILLALDSQATIQDVGQAVNRYLDTIHTLYRQKHESGETPEDKTPLTASFGVAIVRPGMTDIQLAEAQKMADICLFVAKNKGKDQIQINYVDELYLDPVNRTYWRPAATGENIPF